ncbi:MAG: hypothetical protein U0636_00140 [Phycisphaerales bacterium]
MPPRGGIATVVCAALMALSMGAVLRASTQSGAIKTLHSESTAHWSHLRLTLPRTIVEILTCQCELPSGASQSLTDAYATYAAAMDRLESDLGPRCDAAEAKIEAIRTKWKDEHHEKQMQGLVPIDAPLDEEGMWREVMSMGIEDDLLKLQQAGMRGVFQQAEEFSAACKLVIRESDWSHVDMLVHLEMLRREGQAGRSGPADFWHVFDPGATLMEAFEGDRAAAQALGITACAAGIYRVSPRPDEIRGTLAAAIRRADASCVRRLRRLCDSSSGQRTSDSAERAQREFAAEASEMIGSAFQSIDELAAAIEAGVNRAAANRWLELALCKMAPSLARRWFAEDGALALVRQSGASDPAQERIQGLIAAFQEEQRSRRLDAIRSYARVYSAYGEIGVRTPAALRQIETVGRILEQGDRQQDKLIEQIASELGEAGPQFTAQVAEQRARDKSKFDLADRFRERIRQQ